MSQSQSRTHHIWPLVALVLVLAMALTSCVAPAPQVVIQTPVVEKQVQVTVAPAPSTCATIKDHYKIGFANLTEDIVFTQLVEQGMKEAAKASGKVDLVIADNKLDGATALANANNFLTQSVDGVVEFQTDEKFGNVIMDKFRAKDPQRNKCRI
jgi:ABC-type sugar transport system substrate-binding protein